MKTWKNLSIEDWFTLTATEWSTLRVDDTSQSLSSSYQGVSLTSCVDGVPTWYDSFNSTVDYKLRMTQKNVDISLQYAACVLYVPERNGGEVWVGGYGGILAINVSTNIISSIYQSSQLVSSMFRYGDSVLVLIGGNIVNIMVSDLSCSADNGIGTPTGISSVAMTYGNLVVGASDGVYVKDASRIWRKTLQGVDNRVYYLGDLLLSYDNTNTFYSSTSGVGWTIKGNVLIPVSEANIINDVVKYRGVYFATESGLMTDNSTFYGANIQLANVALAGAATLIVNDVATDGNMLVAGLADGTYYVYSGSGFGSASRAVGLDTIHKAIIVDSNIWLFGYDKVSIVSTGNVFKLATGNKISWQRTR